MPWEYEEGETKIVAGPQYHQITIIPVVEPKGVIVRKEVPSSVAPGGMFAIVVWFRNDAEEAIGYYVRFVGVGKTSGALYFDVKSAVETISPGSTRALSSGTQIMPSEDIEVTITVEA